MAVVYESYEWRLTIDWTRSGTWVDESAYLVSANGRRQLGVPEAGVTIARPTVDRATFTLDNSGGRFAFWGGALSATVGDGDAYDAGVRFDVRKDGNYHRVFTGRIKSVQLSGRTPTSPYTLTIDCRSLDDAVLQQKRSTTYAGWRAFADAPRREGEIIAGLLTLAGYTDGTHFRSAAWVAANGGPTVVGHVTVDAGNYVIPWFWLDDESLLEEAWALAGACGGQMYTNAEGVFYYRAVDWWARVTTPTQIDEYVEAVPMLDDRELYSSVVLEIAARDVEGWQVVWEPDAAIVVPPDDEVVVTAKLSAPLYDFSVAAYTAITYGGNNITADVDLSVSASAQRMTLTFTNNNMDYAAVLRNLSISGQPVTGARDLERTFATADSYWSTRPARVKSVRGNLYIQGEAHATSIGTFLRDRFERPRMFWRLVGTARPDLELGAHVYINDAGLGMSTPRYGYITARQWTATQAGYGEVLEFVDRDGLFDYYGTSPDYFVIGTDKLGAASSPTGRVFY